MLRWVTMNLRTCGTHSYRSATQFHAVCRHYRLLRFSVVSHLDKRKASGLICFEVRHHLKPLHCTMLLEDRTIVLFSGAWTQVSNKNIVHNGFLFISASSCRFDNRRLSLSSFRRKSSSVRAPKRYSAA